MRTGEECWLRRAACMTRDVHSPSTAAITRCPQARVLEALSISGDFAMKNRRAIAVVVALLDVAFIWVAIKGVRFFFFNDDGGAAE